VETLDYDKLILSPGASPVQLDIPGFERMRPLRTVEDAERLVNDVAKTPRSAVVVGAGFVGLETAENLVHHGIIVTVIEAAPQVLPALDPELAILVEEELIQNGVAVITGVSVAEVHDWGVTLSDGREIEGEMVVASVDVIIQAARLRDGSRRITHITEVMGMEGETIITQDLFVYELLGEDAQGKLKGRHRSTGIGRPRFWDRARYFGEEKRLAAALDSAEVKDIDTF